MVDFPPKPQRFRYQDPA